MSLSDSVSFKNNKGLKSFTYILYNSDTVKLNLVLKWKGANEISVLFTDFYRKDLEKQEGGDLVAHERLTEPLVAMELLLAKPRSFSNLRYTLYMTY